MKPLHQGVFSHKAKTLKQNLWQIPVKIRVSISLLGCMARKSLQKLQSITRLRYINLRRNHYLLTMFQEIQKNSKEKRKELDDSVKLAQQMLE